MTFPRFDPYAHDKERAAKERAEWRKGLPHKGSRLNGALWKGGLAKRKQRPVTLAGGQYPVSIEPNSGP